MKKGNILLVDDDEIYLYLVKKILSKISEKIAISSFTDGEQAINFISNQTEVHEEVPEVILLDVNMPFLDGWGFLVEFEKLKPRLEKSVRIYLVTSSALPSDKQRAKEFQELTGYFVKPITEDNLKNILTEVYETNF
ncbi:response regulator [Cellulophaga baltica]|uniref:response regulator n=1 Tax=Cellulophaga baltica TaxID=76594 RepID=UPI0037C533A5